MEHLTRNKIMVNPTNVPDFDLTRVFEWAFACITFLWGWAKYIDKSFESKKQEKQEFIEKIVSACVKTTMDEILKDVKTDINILFKYREEDRKHIDSKFDKIMIELKK